MRLVVRDIRRLTASVVSFEFASETGAPLPEHRPGAHLALTLDVDDQRIVRRYSIVSDARDRAAYRIAVLRDRAGGIGSAHLHEAVRVGDTIEVSGPHHGFELRADAPHSLLIAGGIGVTPILSMLRALVASGHSFELHYAARRSDDCAFAEEIRAIAGPRVRFSFGDLGERLDVRSVLAGTEPGTHVYACGPRSLVEDVRRSARALGYERSRVHIESFGPRRSASDRPVALTLAQSGMTLAVDPGTTLLDAMLAAGVYAPAECMRGECATCVATVLEGEVDHRDVCLDDAQRAASMCPCVSWPRGERLTLDL